MPKIPHVSINMAMTINGKSMLSDGTWRGLTSGLDRENMDRLRSSHDAIFCGAASLRADNAFLLDRRNPEHGSHPLPFIFTASGNIDPDLRAFQSPHPRASLVCPRTAWEKIGSRNWLLGRKPEFVQMEHWEDLDKLMTHLYTEKNIHSILLEGGPTLNSIFFERGLVRDLYITLVPYVLGGNGSGPIDLRKDTLVEGATLVSSQARGNEIFCHYRFKM